MRLLFVYPGDLDTPTGGYRYDRAIIEELEKLGNEVSKLSLAGNYPFPSSVERGDAIDLLSRVDEHDLAVVDGLAGGAHPGIMQLLAGKMPVAALVHHPLCLESGLEKETANKLEASEREALDHAQIVITTSPQTASTVATLFDFPENRIHCVVPGVDKGWDNKGWIDKSETANPKSGQTLRLLSVGSVIVRKGHLDLLAALGKLQHLDWQLDCIGKTDFDPALYDRVCSSIASLGLEERVRFHGALPQEELEQFYQHADIFVLPSLYEGYGIVYTEAVARGIPVIATTAGAIPDTVPAGCGILVEPGNRDELGKALEELMNNTQKRARMRQACHEARNRLAGWKDAGWAFAMVLERELCREQRL